MRSWYGSGWGSQRMGMSQNVYQQSGVAMGGLPGTIALGRISVTATVAMVFRLQ